MNNFLVPFISGLACLIALFALSLFLVLGGKFFYIWIKQFFPSSKSNLPSEQEKPTPVKKQTPKPRNRQSVKKPSPVRSIEIDPSQIDRIYVKKTS